MDLLLVLFGAVLALAGGLVTQWLERASQQHRDEEQALLEAMNALLEFAVLLDRHDYRDFLDDVQVPAGDRLELINRIDELAKIAVRLRTKHNRDIALRITKVALDPTLRTPENVYTVQRQVQMRVNSKMIEQYEREISQDRAKF